MLWSVQVVSTLSPSLHAVALQDDATWEDWLAVVMRLLTGYPLAVQLAQDNLGNPDFMNAW